MKRLGVDGRLAPFFKCVCVYVWASGGAPSPGAAAAKCAPVLCLLLAVLLHLHRAALPQHKGAYARLVAGGLALSALGDALLVWPHTFVWGMAAFAGAHLAYVAAFGPRPRALLAGAALYGAAAAYLSRVAPLAPAALRWLVPPYTLLLTTMAWRGAARGGPAAVGALLFLVSDAVLGYSLFAEPLPYDGLLVMSTYYLGQLGIALSALAPPPERSVHDA